jgi:hypothetical protein
MTLAAGFTVLLVFIKFAIFPQNKAILMILMIDPTRIARMVALSTSAARSTRGNVIDSFGAYSA